MLTMPTASTRAGSNEDSVLLARLVAGDDAGLAEAYDAFAELVLGVARRVTGETSASEDVVQEVFVHLWQHPDQVDLGRCSLRGWLSVLAHRRAVDWVRREERRRAREERAGRDTEIVLDPGGVDLADWVAVVDRVSRARRAVESLPPEQRRAVELAYVEGCTYRQVGERLGIPEGTAKSRLRLGLAKLASTVEGEAW